MKIEENKNKKKKLKTTCIDWIKSSSFVGLPNVFNETNIIIRLLWLLFFLISLILFLIQSIQQIQEFQTYKVNRQINIASPQIPLLFPILTIFNINFLSTEYGAQFAQQIISTYLNNSNKSNSTINELSKSVFLQKSIIQANAKVQNESIQRKFGLFGSPASKSIITCLFDGSPCNLQTDFDWYFDSKYGNCFKFNSNQNKRVRQTGSKNGLYIELYIGDDDELVSFTRNRGIHLFISNNTFIEPSTDGIDLPPGMSSDISITYSITRRLQDPFSNCKSLNSYSQTDCNQNCYQENIIKNCSCYDTRFNNKFLTNQRPCIEIDDFFCSNKFLKEFGNSTAKNKCDLNCPDECRTVKFEQRLSFSDFPSESYSNYLINSNKNTLWSSSHMNYTKLKKSSTAFDLYFDEFIFTSINEVPALSLNDLISNVGGYLALYIGISLVSLCQFLEIFIKLILIFLNKKKDIEQIKI